MYWDNEISDIQDLILKFDEAYETEYKNDRDLYLYDSVQLVYKIANIVGVKINNVL